MRAQALRDPHTRRSSEIVCRGREQISLFDGEEIITESVKDQFMGNVHISWRKYDSTNKGTMEILCCLEEKGVAQSVHLVW
ncbi:hypothetical protein TNIN_17981 [Trichonephila inaurata madagascariensis]|uniref:Uncharacterized protein n=1 Tax=Trichonephila inaurata madagascariensis TaxID=2747483 RepID=A0A8X6X4K6_9ARAC|nr:hypothetical protein TNIN_17981 [Trichonephila inaurata madagascariensis]